MPIFDSAQNTEFYNLHSAEYRRDTDAIQLDEQYRVFTRFVPAGSLILDAGCGPGRDMVYFSSLGYQVCGFDAAKEMVEIVRQRNGFDVRQLRFQELEDDGLYDGIWACASLLHVPYIQMPEVFKRLKRALKPGGILYISMKYGQGEIQMRGRWFSLMDETRLAILLQRVGGFKLLHMDLNRDERPDHMEWWLNAVIQRAEETLI